MLVFVLDKALGHKLDQNWPHIKKTLVTKYCRILSWNLSF
jgi:hypothetical protein